MMDNVAGNYIDNAIAAVDAELAKGTDASLEYIRRELLMMKQDANFAPSFGRVLVDQGLENKALGEQLSEVAYWRIRALERNS